MISLELLILGTMIFGAVFCFLMALMGAHEGHSPWFNNRIRKRMLAQFDMDDPVDLPEVYLLRDRYRNDLNVLDQQLLKIPGVEMRLDHSNFEVAIKKFRSLCLMAAFGAWVDCVALLAMGSKWYVALIISMLTLALPVILLHQQASKKLEAFEQQLPDALDTITRALKAGYPFLDTIRLISTECQAPLGAEFKILFEEINAGIDLRSALFGLVKRVPSVSVMAFTTTVLLQRETGGNLSETLSKISLIIRKRFAFKRSLKTLTAEGRMSAWVLGLMPPVLYLVFYIMDPSYAGVLITDPRGKDVLLVGLGLLALGTLWLKRLIRIEV